MGGLEELQARATHPQLERRAGRMEQLQHPQKEGENAEKTRSQQRCHGASGGGSAATRGVRKTGVR